MIPDARFHLVSSHVSVQKYKNVFQQIAIVNLGYDVQNEKNKTIFEKGLKPFGVQLPNVKFKNRKRLHCNYSKVCTHNLI